MDEVGPARQIPKSSLTSRARFERDQDDSSDEEDIYRRVRKYKPQESFDRFVESNIPISLRFLDESTLSEEERKRLEEGRKRAEEEKEAKKEKYQLSFVQHALGRRLLYSPEVEDIYRREKPRLIAEGSTRLPPDEAIRGWFSESLDFSFLEVLGTIFNYPGQEETGGELLRKFTVSEQFQGLREEIISHYLSEHYDVLGKLILPPFPETRFSDETIRISVVPLGGLLKDFCLANIKGRYAGQEVATGVEFQPPVPIIDDKIDLSLQHDKFWWQFLEPKLKDTWEVEYGRGTFNGEMKCTDSPSRTKHRGRVVDMRTGRYQGDSKLLLDTLVPIVNSSRSRKFSDVLDQNRVPLCKAFLEVVKINSTNFSMLLHEVPAARQFCDCTKLLFMEALDVGKMSEKVSVCLGQKMYKQLPKFSDLARVKRGFFPKSRALFHSRNGFELMANLRLSNKSQRRYIRELGRKSAEIAKPADFVRVWTFGIEEEVFGASETEEITVKNLKSEAKKRKLRKEKGVEFISNRNDFVLNAGSYSEVSDRIEALKQELNLRGEQKVEDKEVAQWMRQIIRGEGFSNFKDQAGRPITLEDEQSETLATITYMLFGCEVARSPAALTSHQLMLDEIIYSGETWQEFLNSKEREVKGKTERDGGVMPMSMKEAVANARKLHERYDAHMSVVYKYDGDPSESRIDELIKRENELLKRWCTHTGVDSVSPILTLTQVIEAKSVERGWWVPPIIDDGGAPEGKVSESGVEQPLILPGRRVCCRW